MVLPYFRTSVLHADMSAKYSYVRSSLRVQIATSGFFSLTYCMYVRYIVCCTVTYSMDMSRVRSMKITC